MKEISDEELDQLKEDFKFIIKNAHFKTHAYHENMRRLERMAEILGKLTAQEEKSESNE